MTKERQEKAIDAFRKTFPHLGDCVAIADLWLEAVDWADKHNGLVDVIRKYLGIEEPEVDNEAEEKGK